MPLRNPTLNPDRTVITGMPTGKDALVAWIDSSLAIVKGVYPYIPPDFGIDLMKIMNSSTPDEYLATSIYKTLTVHPYINDIEVTVNRHSGLLTCTIYVNSIYGVITINEFKVNPDAATY
jgi:hypothetical protein